ncbi:MAG: DUF3455 domain-containing protein [Fischerella sp.]|jgi:hypothetical protein|uniref:DUF3455 domain-containing protein n=1 Tax=Fischerella sp. TaxID=1191 RepID=UPI0017DA6386|nr:DUF3455 domain-containing protein [Fischerella sp.]NWF60618.1 DUF3455 domain-containing protein [Fischerella sp.]
MNTVGGKAPTQGCDRVNANGEVRIGYQANYYFWGGVAKKEVEPLNPRYQVQPGSCELEPLALLPLCTKAETSYFLVKTFSLYEP